MVYEQLPIYLVGGWLESGKTSLINELLSSQKQYLIIQFEKGMKSLDSKDNVQTLYFSKKLFDAEKSQIAKEIYETINEHMFDEIWVELNGMSWMSEFIELLDISFASTYAKGSRLRDVCDIEKVITLVNKEQLKSHLDGIGARYADMIAQADLILLDAVTGREKNVIRRINPGVSIYSWEHLEKLDKRRMRKRDNLLATFLNRFIIMVILYGAGLLLLDRDNQIFNRFVQVFLGIMFQAVPFLMLGTIISGAIQMYVPRRWIDKYLAKSVIKGMAIATVAGFFLPVCDCASIPIFRSLIKKKIPLPVALVFMLTSPIVNPVVLLSTYYAFGRSWSIVLLRAGLGITVALLVAITYVLRPPTEFQKSGMASSSFSGTLIEYSDRVKGSKGRFLLFVKHTQEEFFDVGKYLLMGALLASGMQLLGLGSQLKITHLNTAIETLILIALAFVLSLCSTSDAVIGRSLMNQLPLGPVMGFLVFGPMMDIKNALLLSDNLTRKSLIRLGLTILVITFLVVMVSSYIGLGGM